MEFRKLNAPSLKELFVTELQNMILSGKLEIGSKLPPERELAESMKVSRAVINSGSQNWKRRDFLWYDQESVLSWQITTETVRSTHWLPL